MVYNALVHCNWSDCVPVQIRVDDNMLMISNCCILPWGWGSDELTGIHSSHPYNPLIAHTFFRAGYIEAWGRGINTVFDYCRAHHYPEPIYKVNGSDINVFFPMATDYEDPETIDYIEIAQKKRSQSSRLINMETVELRILKEIGQTPTITQSLLAEHIGISRRTLQRIISDMVDRKMIERIGSTRSGKWQLLSKQD